MRSPDPAHSASQARTLSDIAECGVHVAHVLADGADDDRDPLFSYTVGLWHSFEQPEVVVFGLPKEVANDLLDALADDVSEGTRYPAGTRHDGLLQGYPVRMLEVPAERFAEHFELAAWAYEGEPVPAVQLVYPDKQGRWPWDQTTRVGFRECQPVIGARETPS